MRKETLHILIIEGNPAEAEFIGGILNGDPLHHFSVQIATSLCQSVKTAGTGRFDAVLLDLYLPDSAGLETAQSLRAAVSEPAIVILASPKDQELAAQALPLDVEDFLLKPDITSPLLTRTLRYAAQRRRDQRALQHLSTLVDSSHHAIVSLTKDLNGVIRSWNRGAERIYGYTADEIVGRSVEILLPPGREGEVRSLLERVRKGEGVEDYETVRRRKDGSLVHVSLSLSAMTSPAGEIVGASSVAVDISARKRAEEELREAKEQLEARVLERTAELAQETHQRLKTAEELKEKERLLIQQGGMAALGETVGFISHQWRQPLNLLGLMVQDLPRTFERGGCTREYLHSSAVEAMRVIRHMAQTVDEFRNFFRPDRESRPFRVSKVLEDTLKLVGASFQTLGVELKVDAERDLTVVGYPNEFSQVILNILVNARDAFLERTVQRPRIVIRLTGGEGRGVITITDNAGGIVAHNADDIFCAGYTTKSPEKGTGLGLYLARYIVERHMNGTLSVANTDGGAQFRIETKTVTIDEKMPPG